MEELIAAVLFALMGSICFLYYRSIKDKKEGFLLANRKFGAIGGMITAVIAIIILLAQVCNKY